MCFSLFIFLYISHASIPAPVSASLFVIRVHDSILCLYQNVFNLVFIDGYLHWSLCVCNYKQCCSEYLCSCIFAATCKCICRADS